jgi:uncharacterized protein YlxP (DUF503 family)
MRIALLTLHVRLEGCDSLKAKRRRLKPMMVRLGREFNVSVAEVDYHDVWQDALVACALVSTENGHAQRSLQKIPLWLERYWPDLMLVAERIEIIE